MMMKRAWDMSQGQEVTEVVCVKESEDVRSSCDGRKELASNWKIWGHQRGSKPLSVGKRITVQRCCF